MIGGSILKKLKWIIYLSLIALLTYIAHPIILRKIFPVSFQEEIIKYSEIYQINPNLIAAVIKVESDFNPHALSPKGAMGLMQIMPNTGNWIAKRMGLDSFDIGQLYDSQMNIELGTWYLQNLHKQFKGDPQLFLAAYNAGSGNVSKWLMDQRFSKDGQTLDYIPFTETRNYIKKVENYQKIYEKTYNLGV